MRPNKLFYKVGMIFFILIIIPHIALCDLKPLEDQDLSKIEAQSGYYLKEKGLRSNGKPGEFFDSMIGEDGFCGENNASTCSTGAGCFNNEPFTTIYPNPIQTYYMNQVPSCRSGGCGK